MIPAIVIGGDYQGLGIIRALGKENIPVYLLDWDICIAKSSKYTKKFFRCPNEYNEEEFIKFLINLGTNGLIYPTTDQVVKIISIHKKELEKLYKIWTPSWDCIKFLYNKKLTYELANKLNIPIPQSYTITTAIFPIIIKPATRGPFYKKTKKKAILVKNKNELNQKYEFVSKIIPEDEIILQEVIPGYTKNLFSWCVFFKYNKVLAEVLAKRERQHPIDFGRSSTFVKTIKKTKEIEDFLSRVYNLLSYINYYGLAEIEFMFDIRDQQYKLLEINPRTWGWHTLSIRAGVNFPLLLYKDINGCLEVSTNNYKNNIKWVRLLTDIPTAIKEILSDRLKFIDYLYSLKGEKEFAVLSKDDILPFIKEFFIIPYLWRKRGF